MKHKPTLLQAALAAMILLSISGFAFVAKTANTSSDSTTNNGLEARADVVPGDKTDSQLEYWEVDEFKSWMEEERAYYQQLADDGDKSFWYKNADEVYVSREWTQADVDALYATWKEQLDLMQQGHQFTKSIETADGGLLAGKFEP